MADTPTLECPRYVERGEQRVTGTFDGQPFVWKIGPSYYPLRLRAKNGKFYELTIRRGILDAIEGRQL